MRMRRGICVTRVIVAAAMCAVPLQCQGQSASGEGQSVAQSGQSGQTQGGRMGGGMGGGAFQNLSPEQKQILLKRIMQTRQARQQASDSTPDGNSAPLNQDSVSLKSDIAYGTDALQRLDVYSPKSAKGPLPIVIFVHGGGWHRGDKAQGDRKEKGSAYVAQDIILVSANYRLAPAVMHPKQVQDIASAFAWLKEHAGEFGGDPNRIFLMGHSAGAQLVDLLGTNDRFLAEKGLGLKDVAGVISLDTASLNLSERIADSGPETGLVGPMIDAAFGKDPKVLKDGSPTLCIQQGKTYPPFLMFCGAKRLNCVAQHKEFEAAMKRAGGKVTVKPVPLNHGDINKASGQPDSEIFKACIAMIKG